MKNVLVNRLLNIGSKEWPRITLAWFLNFVLRMGFVMGWTVTVAMFINRIGIEFLPYLFVLNALLIMLGSFIYSILLKKIKLPLLMISTVLVAGALLITATLFSFTSTMLFFGLILLAQSILLSQLNILLALFIEDLFSPLESQRTFPLIATSETMGSILGGLIIGIMAGLLPSYKFIYLWVISIFFIIPLLLTSHLYSKKLPFLEIQKTENHQKRIMRGDMMKRLLGSQKQMIKSPFLAGLVVIVMMQFMLFTLMEFQYTKAIQQEILKRHPDVSFEIYRYQPETTLKVSLLEVKSIEKPNQIGAKTPISDEIENSITKELGFLQVLFGAGSLVVQILVASRLISSLGIVSSLLLHPLITLLNIVGMAFRFNFFTAATSRGSFEITGKIFQNAYHSSYYAISRHFRDQVKEFLEGIAKPIGIIIAFSTIFIIQNMSKNNAEETFLITGAMFFISIMMIFRSWRLRQNYTELAYTNMESMDIPDRLNAIEILSQKGHQIDIHRIGKILKTKDENKQVKLKVLEALKSKQNTESITYILECLEDKEEDIRQTALETLTSFRALKRDMNEFQPFTRYRTIQTLRELFQKEESIETQSTIIETLTKISHSGLVPFLLTTLKKGNTKIKQACLRACRAFQDPNMIPYLRPYLNDKRAALQAETLVTLWNFQEMRSSLEQHLNKMLKSKKRDVIKATLYALGEIQLKTETPYIMHHLLSKSKPLRHEAAIALGKIQHRASIPYLAQSLTTSNEEKREETQRLLFKLDQALVEDIKNLVEIKVAEYIQTILSEAKATHLGELSHTNLKKLRNAYATVDEYEEVYKIDQILKQKYTRKKLNSKQHALAT